MTRGRILVLPVEVKRISERPTRTSSGDELQVGLKVNALRSLHFADSKSERKLASLLDPQYNFSLKTIIYAPLLCRLICV